MIENVCIADAEAGSDDDDGDDTADGDGSCVLSAVLTLSAGCWLKEVLLTCYSMLVQPAIVNWPIQIFDQACLDLVQLVQ